MLSAILCEGRTDAILLSYLMNKYAKWRYVKNKKPFTIGDLQDNEEANWYGRDSTSVPELLIFGVGGIDNVGRRLDYLIKRSQDDPNKDLRFGRIAIVVDRDKRTDEEIGAMIGEWAGYCGVRLTEAIAAGWEKSFYTLHKTPVSTEEFSITLIIVPPNGQGCLEVFLLEALRSHDSDHKHVVDETAGLITRVKDVRFLQRIRYHSKAQLGAALSVVSPERVFSELHERLNEVGWEQIETIEKAYSLLRAF